MEYSDVEDSWTSLDDKSAKPAKLSHGKDAQNSDDEKSFKRIKLSDGGTVFVTDKRLGRMYKELPVLKFLLEGHPLMKKQQKTLGDNEEKGYDYAISESFGIFMREWTLLVDFFSPSCLEPINYDDWDQLKRVATILGSSDSVDEAYKAYKTIDCSEYNPVRPLDDVKNQFYWIDVNTCSLLPDERILLMNKMADGFKLVHEAEGRYEHDLKKFYRKQK